MIDIKTVIIGAILIGALIYIFENWVKETEEPTHPLTFGEAYQMANGNNDVSIFDKKYTSNKVYLVGNGKVSYLEFFYFDENNEPIPMPLATQCKIHECSADGTVLKESWSRPGDCDVYKRYRKLAK